MKQAYIPASVRSRLVPRPVSWAIAGSIAFGFIGGFGVNSALAIPTNPGAPLDGISRAIFMTENDQETLGSLSWERFAGQRMVIEPNAQGIFILPFALVSGPVSCCEQPGDANSDTIVLTGQPNGTTFINLFSDPQGLETLPFADPGDQESVTVSDGEEVPHTTLFRITSGPEPARVPEPATLAMLSGGLFGLGWLRHRRRHTAK